MAGEASPAPPPGPRGIPPSGRFGRGETTGDSFPPGPPFHSRLGLLAEAWPGVWVGERVGRGRGEGDRGDEGNGFGSKSPEATKASETPRWQDAKVLPCEL